MTSAKAFVTSPSVSFRGSRDYVHSTDIYDCVESEAVRNGLNFGGPIEMVFRKALRRRPIYNFAPAVTVGQTADCSFLFMNGLEKWMVSIVEGPTSITARRPYDEGPAHAGAEIVGHTIRRNSQSGLRPIECLTAMAVALHKAAFPPPTNKRWMLAKFRTVRPLCGQDACFVSLSVVRKMGVNTQVSIEAEDGQLGSMVFVLD